MSENPRTLLLPKIVCFCTAPKKKRSDTKKMVTIVTQTETTKIKKRKKDEKTESKKDAYAFFSLLNRHILFGIKIS
jgi:hypothetical protein